MRWNAVLGFILVVVLLGSAAALVPLKDFNSAEGIRAAVEQQYKEDVTTLLGDFKQYNITLPKTLEQEFSGYYYTSRSYVNSYEPKVYTKYQREREYKKALKALLYIQRADISVLSGYAIVKEKAEKMLEHLKELHIKDERIVDAEAKLALAQKLWLEISSEKSKLLDESNVSLTTKKLREEVERRAELIVKLNDFKDMTLQATAILSSIINDYTAEYVKAKEEFYKNDALIRSKLNDIENQLSFKSSRKHEFRDRLANLRSRYSEIVTMVDEEGYLVALNQQQGLLRSINDLERDIRLERERVEAEIARLAHESKRRKGIIVTVLIIAGCLVPIAWKLREVFMVDEDLQPVKLKETAKVALVSVIAAVVMLAITSAYTSFPFSFFPMITFSFPTGSIRIKPRKTFFMPQISVNSRLATPFNTANTVNTSLTKPFSDYVITPDMIFDFSSQEDDTDPPPDEEDAPPLPLPETDAEQDPSAYIVKVTEDVLNSMAIHAISSMKPVVKECYGTIYANAQGVIVKYHPIDSEDYTLRSSSRVSFTQEFYNHVRRLAELYKAIGLRLAGDHHSHPNGSPEQSENDIAFNKSFWKTRRNTCFITAISKHADGNEYWEVRSNGYEVSRKMGGYLVRIRAYAGSGNDGKKIIITT